MATFYKHSGQAPVLGLINAFICGSVVAAVAAVIYSYAIVYIPFIYVNFIVTACFGGIVGWVVYWIARKGHIRNNMLPVIIAFVCGLVGLYVAWGVDLLARVGLPQDANPLVCLDPRVVLKYMQFGYENGFWAIGSRHAKGAAGNVSGIFVAIVWLIEAGMIVGIPMLMCLGSMSALAYCEPCGRWTSDAAAVRKVEPTQALSIVEALQQGNVGPLVEAPLAGPTSNDFLRVQIQCCDQCPGSNYLTLERVRITIDEKKNKSEKSTTLINKLAVTAEDVALVCNQG
jgi:hypothetical protein